MNILNTIFIQLITSFIASRNLSGVLLAGEEFSEVLSNDGCEVRTSNVLPGLAKNDFIRNYKPTSHATSSHLSCSLAKNQRPASSSYRRDSPGEEDGQDLMSRQFGANALRPFLRSLVRSVIMTWMRRNQVKTDDYYIPGSGHDGCQGRSGIFRHYRERFVEKEDKVWRYETDEQGLDT